MYTDTHVHLWKLDRGDYRWLKPENAALYRDFSPDMLRPLLEANRVDEVILVEAAATLDETEYMLGLAERYDFIAGVIGGLNPLDDGFQSDYERVKGRGKLLGFRWNGTFFHAESADAPVKPSLLAAMRLLEADGCVAEILVQPGDLAHITPYAALAPELAIVLNHLGGPGKAAVQEGGMEPWMGQISEIAAFPNVNCKISGTITLAEGFHPEKLTKHAAHLFEAFGSKRLLFGSDWPVALLGGSYGEVVRLFERLLPEGLPEEERDAVRFRNAQKIYKLDCREGAQ